jgi:glutamine amidotransferase
MCVIAVKPEGVKWPGKQYMRNCFTNNSDGAGVAWADGSGLHVEKGFFAWEALWKKLRQIEEFPAMLHCRLATHGSISRQNCHPFRLGNGVVMAHNGIISTAAVREIIAENNMTDSEAFGRLYIGPVAPAVLDEPGTQESLEDFIGSGNLIALLKPDGRFIILNRQYGRVFRKVWFSNGSYQYGPELYGPLWPVVHSAGYDGEADYDRGGENFNDPFYAGDHIPPGYETDGLPAGKTDMRREA